MKSAQNHRFRCPAQDYAKIALKLEISGFGHCLSSPPPTLPESLPDAYDGPMERLLVPLHLESKLPGIMLEPSFRLITVYCGHG